MRSKIMVKVDKCPRRVKNKKKKINDLEQNSFCSHD
ncbi:hypothetical protein G5O_0608 [Chlamydia psittaci 6BC]|nr:hypothetical protein G5O_0608 [Chlamydia psittaci 6BC]